MRISSTVLRRLAQPRRSSIPKPNSDFPTNLCFPRGGAWAKSLSLYAGFSHCETGLRQPTASALITDSDFSANVEISQRLWAWSKPHFAPASSARLGSHQGRRAAGELVPLWDLLSRAPCSRPGLTLPGRTKQTQRQHSCSERGIGWHCMHTTISRCRQRLAFGSGPQANS